MRRLLTCTAAVILVFAGLAAAQKPAPKPEKPEPLLATLPDPAIFAERADKAGFRGVKKRVLALYYPWYGMPPRSGRWLHYDKVDVGRKKIGSHTHYPVSGPYDSLDPVTIDLHLQQAKQAGIDTLVCSWWGRKDPTDKAIRALLARAPSHGVSVCIYWEKLAGGNDPKTAAEELVYLVKTFGSQQGYLTLSSKPVIFIYERACRGLLRDDWAAVLLRVEKEHRPGVIAIGSGNEHDDLVLWDGLHTIDNIAQLSRRELEDCARMQSILFRAPIQAGKALQRISVVTVTPGFELPGQRTRTGPKRGIFLDRARGRMYSALWQQAIQDGPNWVLINSFNQWHSGTEIEPAVEFGDRYLKLTAQHARQFKSGTRRPRQRKK